VEVVKLDLMRASVTLNRKLAYGQESREQGSYPGYGWRGGEDGGLGDFGPDKGGRGEGCAVACTVWVSFYINIIIHYHAVTYHYKAQYN
jgi:hypothetical protein